VRRFECPNTGSCHWHPLMLILKKCCAQRSNSRGAVIRLARNELTRDMFMAGVRRPTRRTSDAWARPAGGATTDSFTGTCHVELSEPPWSVK
jgi:hypothetical protein